MAIGYVVVKRNITTGFSPGEKYLAVIEREKQVDFETIAEQIVESSSMSKGDVMGVLQQLEQQMSFHLLRGASVKLGLLGIFQPAFKAKARDTQEEVTSDTITRIYINYRPSTWLRKKMLEANKSLVKLEKKGYVSDTETTAP